MSEIRKLVEEPDLIERLKAYGALFWNGDADERIAGRLMHEAASTIVALRAAALDGERMRQCLRDAPLLNTDVSYFKWLDKYRDLIDSALARERGGGDETALHLSR